MKTWYRMGVLFLFVVALAGAFWLVRHNQVSANSLLQQQDEDWATENTGSTGPTITALTPRLNLSGQGLRIAVTGVGMENIGGGTRTFSLNIGGPVRQAYLYWAGRERPCSHHNNGYCYVPYQPYKDQQLIFDGYHLTGSLAGSFAHGDRLFSVGYLYDVTSIVQARGTGPQTFTIRDGNTGNNFVLDGASRFNGAGLIVVYEDQSDTSFHRVLTFDGVDFAYGSPATPVIFDHSATGHSRAAQVALFAGDAESDPDRIEVGSTHHDNLLNSSDGLQWDKQEFNYTIPTGVGSTSVRILSPDIPGQGHDSIIWLMTAMRFPCAASIGDFVWHDLNGNGLQDTGEPGIGGVTMRLRDTGGSLIATTTTAADGGYQFNNLCAGAYTVRVAEATLPAGFVPTLSNAGDDNYDSNGSPAQVTLPADNSSNQSIDFGYVETADLAVILADDPDPVVAGETLTYTLTVHNAGPCAAQDVEVSHLLPAEVILDHASPPPDGGPNPLTWSLGTLAVGETRTFTVVVNVPPWVTATLWSAAQVDSTTLDPDESNNQQDEATEVVPLADLAVTLADDPDPVVAGETLAYTFTVHNAGPSVAQAVEVSHLLPGEVILDHASPPPHGGPNPLTWNLGALPVGETRTFTVAVNVPSWVTETLWSTAQVDSTTLDPDENNNQQDETTQVMTRSDLAITKTDAPDPVIAGETLAYTLVVTNTGPSDARATLVSDTLPAGLSLLAADPAPAGGPNPLLWSLGTLPAGEHRVITAVFAVDSWVTQTLTNTAVAASAEPDPNPIDNRADEPTAVETLADLSVVKADNPDPALPGELLTYTLTVHNAGPSDAQRVVLVDTLPNEVTFLHSSPPRTSGPNPSVWNLSTVVAGEDRIVTVVVRVKPWVTQAFTNIVVVTSLTPEPEPGNNADEETTHVPADLSLTLADDPDPVTAGRLLTYTLLLHNAGPATAQDVVLSDTLPAEVRFVSATPPPAGGPAPQLWQLGTLAAGENRTITVVVAVEPWVTHTFTNTAHVGSETPDINPGNNRADEPTGVLAEADLSLSLADDPDPATAGRLLTYTLLVHNAGPSVAQDVISSDSLPAEVQFVSATPPPTGGPGPLVWHLGAIDPAASRTITVVVAVEPWVTQTFTDHAEVASPTFDPHPGNNQADEPTSVLVEADLSLSLADAPDPATAGRLLTYTLLVHNAGPSVAQDAVLSDSLPAEVQFVSATPPPTGSPGPLVWHLGALDPAARRTLTVVVAVEPWVTHTFTDHAEVASPTFDPLPENNQADEPTGVLVEADLSVVKTDDPDPVGAGARLTYTLVVSNAGPSDAQDVLLADLLPGEITFLWAEPPPSDPDPLSWKLGSLLAGESRLVTIVGQVAPESARPLVNYAEVTGASPDPEPENNYWEERTQVQSGADLSVVKTDDPDPVLPGAVLTYTLTVHNAGPAPALDVVLSDTLPAKVAFWGASPPPHAHPQPQQLLWKLGTLDAGASRVFVVTTTVQMEVADVFTNHVAVAASTLDPRPENNVDDEPTGVPADLSLTKADHPDPASPGETLTYTLLVYNAGPAVAMGIVVSDALPAGVTFVGATPPPGSGPNPLTWDLGALAPGESRALTVVAQIEPWVTGTLTNTAAVTSDTPDPDPSDNNAAEPTLIPPKANLSVVKSAAPNPVVAGERLTYTLTVINAGPSAAQGVVVSDTLPGEVVFVSATPPQHSGPNPLIWHLGVLAAGESRALTVVVQIEPWATGTITNAVVVGSHTDDPDASDNQDEEPVLVTTEADLSIVKADDPDPALVGGLLTYTLLITNAGPSAAQGVVVSDTLPGEVAFVSASPSQHSGPNPLIWHLGTLAAGESRALTVVVAVQTDVTKTFTNTASVGSDTDEYDLDDNRYDEPTSVPTDLSVVKLGNPDPVLAGEYLTYTLLVTNAGPAAAPGVVVSDTLPDGVSLVQATPPQSDGPNPLLWELGALAAGESRTITVVVAVEPWVRQTLTNSVVVDSEAVESNPDNNRDEETVQVETEANLSIVKTDDPDPVLAGERLTYTLVVSNAGPSVAQGVVVSDTLPEGVALVNAEPLLQPGTGLLHWNLGTLAPGEKQTIPFVVQVEPWVTDTITNSALVDSGTPDPAPGDNFDEEPTKVETWADLAVRKSDSPDPVLPGEHLTYTLLVFNTGPADALTVMLTDTLPASVIFVQATPPPDSGPNPLLWNLSTLPAGESREITVVVQVPLGLTHTLTNSVVIGSATPDPNLDDNQDKESTYVDVAADLSVFKSDRPDPVRAGETLTYTLAISNSGLFDAPEVVVSDALPDGISLLHAVPGPSAGPHPLLWYLDTLAMGEGRRITVVVAVESWVTATFTNSVAVASALSDPNPDDNRDDEPTQVLVEADLSVVKTDHPDPVWAGEVLTYTLVVANNGPADAQGAILSDTLPAEVEFLSATPAPDGGPNPLFWSLGTLAAGESQTLTVVVQVPSWVTQPLSSTAVVAATTPDPEPANNRDDEPTEVEIMADLAVAKGDAPDPVVAGETLTYTLVISNGGPSDAAGVTLHDTLAPGVTLIGADPPPDSGPSPLVWALGDLAAGQSRAVVVVVHVEPWVTATFTNTATVAAATPDDNPTNNTDEEPTAVLVLADISLAKADDPDPVWPGEALTYTLTVHNAGPSDARTVAVVDMRPAETAMVGSIPPHYSGPNPLIWFLDQLAVNESRTLTLTMTVHPWVTHTFTNTAVAVSIVPDPDLANNWDREPTQVPTDISVIKADDPDPVVAGEPLTYTLVVSNAGPSDAENVVVSDTLPVGVSFVGATPPPVSGPVPLIWELGTLPTGEQRVITVTATVESWVTKTLTNTVIVTSETEDANLTDNRDDESTTVETEADLAVVKADAPDPVMAGGRLTYTLVVSNAGPSDALTVVVSDTLPDEVELVTANPPPSSGPNPLIWEMGDLPAGASRVITVVVAVQSWLTHGVTNTVAVTTTTRDTVPANNRAAEFTAVEAEADVGVVKGDDPDPVAVEDVLTYTLTVSNAGPSDALAVVVSDTLPAGVSFLNADPPPGGGPNPLVWTLDTLSAGEGRAITVVVTVESWVTQSLTNTAIVTTTTPDPNPTNNRADESTAVRMLADLSIVKADTPDPVLAGETLTYTLAVSNAGPSEARTVVVSDLLPAGVTLVDADPPPDGMSQPLLWNLGALPAGEGRAITVVVAVESWVTQTFTNTTAVTSTIPDPEPANNRDDEATGVLAAADLSIAKTDAPDPTTAGAWLTYTLAIHNAGPSDAANVVVSDTLPPEVSFLSADPPTDGVSQPLLWSLGALPAGEGRAITVVVAVESWVTQTFTNTTAVTSTIPDPEPANNRDDEATGVLAAADMSIAKTDAPDPTTAGAWLTYTLAIHNAGPSDAVNVTVSDTLPLEVSFLSADPPTDGVSQPLLWSLGALPAGEGRAITLVVAVESWVTQTFTNTTAVTSTIPDPEPANNRDDEATSVQIAADLSVVKADSPDPVLAGGWLTYTLMVHNAGPSDAANVIVSDTLPLEVSFLSADPPADGVSQPLLWSLGALPAGEGRAITLIVAVESWVTQTFTNTTAVTSTMPDLNPANNRDDEATSVQMLADLSIVKADDPDPVLTGEWLTYTLLIHNAGPSDAVDVTVTDTLPSGVLFVRADPALIDADAPPFWELGSLATGESRAITLVVEVRSWAALTFTNTAVVTSTTFDPDPANNRDDEPTSHQPDSPPPPVPEASTLVLLSSALAGLAAYVGRQFRARRG